MALLQVSFIQPTLPNRLNLSSSNAATHCPFNDPIILVPRQSHHLGYGFKAPGTQPRDNHRLEWALRDQVTTRNPEAPMIPGSTALPKADC
jgi:hypothetical protein